MKTLVNKANPVFRITSPEIIEEEEYYTFDGETVFLKEYWTLVEEEPKHTEVWLEGRTIFEQEQKPVENPQKGYPTYPLSVLGDLLAKIPEADLEKEIEKKWNECDSIDEGMGDEYANIVIEQFDEICKYFYELGQREMRNRIINPEYNKQVVDKMKSEYPELGQKGGSK